MSASFQRSLENPSRAVFLTVLPLRVHNMSAWGCFSVVTAGKIMLLGSSEWRPGMLLYFTTQCRKPRSLPRKEAVTVMQTSVESRSRNPALVNPSRCFSTGSL